MSNTMPAGHELDALVAEKVMGWQWRRNGMPDSPRFLLRADYPSFCMTEPATGSETIVWLDDAIGPPAFSTNVAAAWSVFEEGLLRFGSASICADMESYGRGAFTGGDAEKVMHVRIGDCCSVGPMPLAVCRAALKAVGVDA